TAGCEMFPDQGGFKPKGGWLIQVEPDEAYPRPRRKATEEDSIDPSNMSGCASWPFVIPSPTATPFADVGNFGSLRIDVKVHIEVEKLQAWELVGPAITHRYPEESGRPAGRSPRRPERWHRRSVPSTSTSPRRLAVGPHVALVVDRTVGRRVDALAGVD